jgi:hypothetical protein
MTNTYPSVEPHGELQQITEDCWYVTGSVRFKPLLRLPRNMIVLRHEGELTLINSVRLNEAGERSLEALGKIAHIMTIGFHQMDDAYYLNRYGVTQWLVPGAEANPEAGQTFQLTEDAELPIPKLRVFLFKETIRGEAALLLERDAGLLITCDSVQHWVPSELMSPLAKLVTRLIGFQQPAQIGPPWRKRQTPEGGSLRGDFERLLELPFERLIGGHGGLLERAAPDLLAISIEREL